MTVRWLHRQLYPYLRQDCMRQTCRPLDLDEVALAVPRPGPGKMA